MTRRRLLLFALPAALVLLGACAWVVWPCASITQENAERIQSGMTLAEVEVILGGPARQDTTGPVSPDGFDGEAIPDGNVFESGVAGDDEEVVGWDRRWLSDTVFVMVRFDRDNHVLEVRCRPMYRVERGFLETVSRWLRL
jgi:hypothetical protein